MDETTDTVFKDEGPVRPEAHQCVKESEGIRTRKRTHTVILIATFMCIDALAFDRVLCLWEDPEGREIDRRHDCRYGFNVPAPVIAD